MTQWRARILYEDSDIAPFHRLICACVDDACGTPWTAANVVEGVSRRGVNKVLESCADERFFADGATVFALLDADDIRRALALPGNAAPATVDAALTAKCKAARGFLLDRNLETVIAAIGDCASISSATLERALAKTMVDRDGVLGKATHASPAVRRCVLDKVPSLEKLVTALCAIVCPPA